MRFYSSLSGKLPGSNFKVNGTDPSPAILGHEDLGMMNIIRVQSPYVANNGKPDGAAKPVGLDSPALEIAGQEVAPALAPPSRGTLHPE